MERARESFGSESDAAHDLLELTEVAWHDCYNEVTPSDQVVEDPFWSPKGQSPASPAPRV